MSDEGRTRAGVVHKTIGNLTPIIEPERRSRRGWWVLGAFSLPVIAWLGLNIAILELRRQIFLSTCTEQAGLYRLDSAGNWERFAAPDCATRVGWRCALNYRGPPISTPPEWLAFRFTSSDDFGPLRLTPLPRVTFGHTPDGRSIRITNFASADLDQWDVMTFAYPTQSMCFFPLVA